MDAAISRESETEYHHLFFSTALNDTVSHGDEYLFFADASTESSNHSSSSDDDFPSSNWAKPHQDRDTQMPSSLSRQSFQSASTHQRQLSIKSCTSNPQSSDLLHFACAIQSKSFDVIERLVLQDLSAAHCRMSDRGKIIMQKALIASNKKLSKSVERKSVSWIKPRYTFPLNIAIQYNADPRVLELLANIAPLVLEMTDGPNMESSLHIAIKHHCPAESIDMMLMAMPSAAATKDRHSNTPLHAACLFRPHDKDDLIRNLLLHQPAAANEENFHGHTPLRLLERSNQHVSETTLNLMQRGHCFERSLFSETPSRRMTGATAFI